MRTPAAERWCQMDVHGETWPALQNLASGSWFYHCTGARPNSLMKSPGWLFCDLNGFRSLSHQLMVSHPASTMACANPVPQREEVVCHGCSQHAGVQQCSKVSAPPDRETQHFQHRLGKQPASLQSARFASQGKAHQCFNL